jgi:hypothetical protein
MTLKGVALRRSMADTATRRPGEFSRALAVLTSIERRFQLRGDADAGDPAELGPGTFASPDALAVFGLEDVPDPGPGDPVALPSGGNPTSPSGGGGTRPPGCMI